jgi:uncharacterized OsmC-like protein
MTQPSSRALAAYLRQKAESLRAAALRRPTGPAWRDTVEATCTADDVTGVRKLRIRDWQFIGDSGPDFGGWNLGPSSPELLCGVVSTCLTHTYEIGAATMSIPVDRIQVRVTANNNDARFLDIPTEDPALPWDLTAHVTVDAPAATADQLAALHRYASERCPLTNLIRNGAPVEVRLEA